ncbi:hypothetical protein EXE43_04495 [Halorubrum sp. SS5]|nr:hypothetical protein EXE43_04495 [Halorubrum sp. SS5]
MTEHTPELPYPDDPASFNLRARDWGSALGLSLVAVALVSASASLPIVSLAVLGTAGVVRSAPFAFVLGQVALIPVLSSISPLAGVAQLGLLAVLTEPARSPYDIVTLVVTSISWAALLALVVGIHEQGVFVTGGLVTLAVGAGIYVTYRVTLVRLNLVTPTEPADESNLKTQG